MKTKLFALASALISLVISGCEKSAVSGSDKSESNEGSFTVEDYVNGIVEYNEYDISYVECTEYGALDPEYDACGNRHVFDSGPCGYSIKQRCSTKDPKYCECIDNGNITDDMSCNRESSFFKDLFRKKSTHKYSVETKDTDVKYTYCDEDSGKNKEITIKAVVRKMCLADNDTVTANCECNIVKDNCNNYLKNGKIVYDDKKHLENSNDDCLGYIGAKVDCNNPKLSL